MQLWLDYTPNLRFLTYSQASRKVMIDFARLLRRSK